MRPHHIQIDILILSQSKTCYVQMFNWNFFFRLEQVEKENAKLVLEVLRLNKELSELRKENSSMRIQLADNCIVANLQRAKGQKS